MFDDKEEFIFVRDEQGNIIGFNEDLKLKYYIGEKWDDDM